MKNIIIWVVCSKFENTEEINVHLKQMRMFSPFRLIHCYYELAFISHVNSWAKITEKGG